MKPVSPVFPNRDTPQVVFAEDQPQYLPLPAYKEANGRVTTRWRLSFVERIQVFLKGRLWLRAMTFNHPRQSAKISTTPGGFGIEAKNQPQYVPLRAHSTEDGMRTIRWHFSRRDRLRMLLTGSVWLQVMTFNKPLQPVMLSVTLPEIR